MIKFLSALLLTCSGLFANINAVVSIQPQVTFLKAIGGDKVDVSLMIKPGNSPHTYEPKPSQMRYISKADLYFAIGVEFENVWLKRFKNQNQNLKIVDVSKGIIKTNNDPHIWTNPKNVKIIAKNIYNDLVKIDAKNQAYYKTNLDIFLLHVKRTDKKIRDTIKQNKKFMVFHPSWGYFAKEYGLTQIAIEIEGKNPKPRELSKLIKEAKKQKISVIFTSPEFSDAIAKQIANELNIKVIKVSPLAKNWSKNLLNLAKNINEK